MPGLAAKAPTGISQEGRQLSRDFTFACVLYVKVVVLFCFPKKQEEPGLSSEGCAFLCNFRLPT